MRGATRAREGYRITFPSKIQREIFDIILRNRKMSLKKLAHVLGVNYWTLKHWRLGIYSIPVPVFTALLLLYPEVRIFTREHKPKFRDPSWGARKGGLNSANKFGREKLKERMKYIRSFVKMRPMVRKPELDGDFWEFFGIMWGDGCLSKYYAENGQRTRYCIQITGDLTWGKQYFERHVKPLIEKLFGLNPSIIHDVCNNVTRIVIQSRTLFDMLSSVGYPVGKKKNSRLPKVIMSLPWGYRKRVIRGLLDTDGCLFARKDEGYKYPYVSIASANPQVRKQLVEMLRERGYPAYIHGKDVLIRGRANLRKWMSDIGASNPKNIKRYEDWVKTGKMLPLHGPVAQLGS